REYEIIAPRKSVSKFHRQGEVADQAVAQGHTILAIVLGLPRLFQLRHVYIRLAFRLAALAAQTKVKYLPDFFMVERIRLVRPRDHLAQDVGPCARGILLLQGCHIARTHRSAAEVRLATITRTV